MHDGATIEPPVRGEWLSVRSPGHHRYAFDLVKLEGDRLHAGTALQHLTGTLSVQRHHTWGRPVCAPFDGTVAAARDGWPDRNRLNLTLDACRLAVPTRRLTPDDSLQVRTGDRVAAGDPLVRIGNSGRSLVPHLHMRMMNGPDVPSADVVPFLLRGFERHRDGAWQRVENAPLPKGERLRFPD